MSNMSYCRYRNTLADLRDCYQAMDRGEPPELCEEERARHALVELCEQIAEEYGHGNLLD